MAVPIDIASLSTAEKLALMEELWVHLSANPDAIESPDWHREVLDECRRRMDSGEAKSEELDVVMRRLRATVARENTPA